MSKKNKKLGKINNSPANEKDLVVAEVLSIPKCKYCPQLAFIKIVGENKNAIWVCPDCFRRISEGRKVRKSSSIENAIPLQNNKENCDGKRLFKSTSVITPKNAKWDIVSKKEKLDDKSFSRLVLTLAWEWGDKTSFSLWGDDNKLMVEYNEHFYVFEQTGKPVGELDSTGKNLSIVYQS